MRPTKDYGIDAGRSRYACRLRDARTRKPLRIASRTSKKKTASASLPSGTRGPVPQVPLDAIPAIAPQVSYEDGLVDD